MNVKIVLACSEDSQTNQIVPNIEKQGWQIIVVGTGREALSQIEQTLPLAAIIYIALPDMTGWEVLEQLRKNPIIRSTFVFLVYPSAATDEDIFRGFGLGADNSQVIPFALMVFVNFISRILKAQQEEEFASQT